MKGVILAGGTGSRLFPLTRITNKHLLPVYDRPMIMYSIELLVKLGIKDVALVVGGTYCGEFLRLLGNGSEYGLKSLHYMYQEQADGIAGALGLTYHFLSDDPDSKFIAVLGDNIFEYLPIQALEDFKSQESGARVLITQIDEVERLRHLGVATFEDSRISDILEKPITPPSNLAVSGLYMYDISVFDIISRLKPSGRGELEITDVNRTYIADKKMEFSCLPGFWGDLGESIDSYYQVINKIREKGVNK